MSTTPTGGCLGLMALIILGVLAVMGGISYVVYLLIHSGI